jgi:hypothetical protein
VNGGTLNLGPGAVREGKSWAKRKALLFWYCRRAYPRNRDVTPSTRTRVRAMSASVFAAPGVSATRIAHTRRSTRGVDRPRGGFVVRHASERRARSGDEADKARVAESEAKRMGRLGTNRVAGEDDEDTAAAKRSVTVDGAFGKPSACKETWEPFQRKAREGLLDACLGGPDGDAKTATEADLVVTSMCVAVEDDAFKSRTAVCLPTEAYAKRVDKLVHEFMQRDYARLEVPNGGTAPAPKDVIDALEKYLYGECAYRVPGGWREAYSPYRTYFHNVVAQKVGIPATLAALYIGCVERLKRKGALLVDVDVMIAPKAKGAASGAFGVTQPKAPWGVVRGEERDSKNHRNRGAVVCTPKMSVTLQLQALKRAFWPWEWDDTRDSGVLLAYVFPDANPPTRPWSNALHTSQQYNHTQG